MLKTEVKLREFDKKYIINALINNPTFEGVSDYIPQRWITVGVTNDKAQAYEFQKEFVKTYKTTR